MMGAALMAYQDMQKSSKDMIVTVGNLPRNVSFASDYFTFMDSSEEKKAYDVNFGKISVKDASFTYPKTDNGLHDISLSIYEGESVAIVGYNGSGDSDIMMTDTINPLKSKFKGFHKTFKQDDLGLSLSSFLLN